MTNFEKWATPKNVASVLKSAMDCTDCPIYDRELCSVRYRGMTCREAFLAWAKEDADGKPKQKSKSFKRKVGYKKMMTKKGETK